MKESKVIGISLLYATTEILVRKLNLYEIFKNWPNERGISIIDCLTHFLAGSAIYGFYSLFSDKELFTKLFLTKAGWEIFQQIQNKYKPPEKHQYIFYDAFFDTGSSMLGGLAMKRYLKN